MKKYTSIRALTAADAEAYHELRLQAVNELPQAFGASAREEAAQTRDSVIRG